MTTPLAFLAAMPQGKAFDEHVKLVSSSALSAAPSSQLSRIIPKMSDEELRRRVVRAPLDLAIAMATYATDPGFLSWMHEADRRSTVGRSIAHNRKAPISVVCAEGLRQSRRWKCEFEVLVRSQPIERILLAARADAGFRKRFLESVSSHDRTRMYHFIVERPAARWPSWLGAASDVSLLEHFLDYVTVSREQVEQVADAWQALSPQAEGGTADKLRARMSRYLVDIDAPADVLLARWPWLQLAHELCRRRNAGSGVSLGLLPGLKHPERRQMAYAIAGYGGIVDRDVVMLSLDASVTTYGRVRECVVTDDAVDAFEQLLPELAMAAKSRQGPSIVDVLVQGGNPVQLARVLSLIGKEGRDSLQRATLTSLAEREVDDLAQAVDQAARLDPEAGTWLVRTWKSSNKSVPRAISNSAVRLLLASSVPCELPALVSASGDQVRSMVGALRDEVGDKPQASLRASELMFHVLASEWWGTARGKAAVSLRREVVSLAERCVWTQSYRPGRTPNGAVQPLSATGTETPPTSYWFAAGSIRNRMTYSMQPAELPWLQANAPAAMKALTRTASNFVKAVHGKEVAIPAIVATLIPRVSHQWSAYPNEDVMDAAFAWLQQALGENLPLWETVIALLPEWDGSLEELVSAAGQL